MIRAFRGQLNPGPPVRIACLQFDPQLMDVAGNQERASALVHKALRPGDVDVLLLPEMAFTGYCFASRDEILPFCEDARGGVTAAWCAATAKLLGCVVVAGFPERDGGRLFNSQITVDPAGRPVHIYRKHFLYTTDEAWADEGPGFASFDVPGLGGCAFGICMDLNPKKFAAPFDRFEYASALFDPPLLHHQQPSAGRHRLRANTLLLSNNWLRSPADAALGDEEHCRLLVNYWAYHLSPALDQPVVAAIANRIGIERSVQFAGCSCVIDLHTRTLLGRFDGREEGILVVATDRSA